MAFKKDPSGNVETSSNHDGPTVEIVVTSQTKIYKDVTMRQFDVVHPPKDRRSNKCWKKDRWTMLVRSSMITVWGKKTGDRFIAEILVYSPPAFINKNNAENERHRMKKTILILGGVILILLLAGRGFCRRAAIERTGTAAGIFGRHQFFLWARVARTACELMPTIFNLPRNCPKSCRCPRLIRSSPG